MTRKVFCVNHGKCKWADLTIVHGFNEHENCIIVIVEFIFQMFQNLRLLFPILVENWLEIVWDQIFFGQSKMCHNVLVVNVCFGRLDGVIRWRNIYECSLYWGGLGGNSKENTRISNNMEEGGPSRSASGGKDI